MTFRIPFLDLKAKYQTLTEELDAAYRRVMHSGRFVLGPECDAFEQEFAAHSGARYCVAVANGLDALRTSLLALGVKPGDEVLVPGNTYIATWLAVSQAGARPVPVEPGPDMNIDPGSARAAITPRTKAILPVHLYGQPAAMYEILETARDHNLRVLCDAAQAHGARYDGKPIATWGDASAFSFYPTKNLGAFGDAGAITTDSEEVAEAARTLANYGSPRKNVHTAIGWNSRLDPLQAAFLRALLPRLDTWNQRRAQIASTYMEGLADCDGVELPEVFDERTHAWHQFVVRCIDRRTLQEHLADAGVETMIHYPTPPHLQGAYRSTIKQRLPVSERLAGEVLSIPVNPHLLDDEVAEVVRCTIQHSGGPA